MGLLRKAVGVAGLEPAGAEASEEPTPKTPRARWGLFKKCVDTLKTGADRTVKETPSREPREEPAAWKKPADIVFPLKAALRILPEGLELPSHIFSALQTHLAIEKGALLLYDPLRLVYAPWAARGFDQTTLHKMRIPLGANESFNSLANGKPLAISGAAGLSQFQGYFSAREFGLLSRLVLCPLISVDRLVGVLLATDIRAPLQFEEELLACLLEASEAASPIVSKARDEKLKSAPVPDTRPGATLEEEIERFIGSPASSGKKHLFATLSLAGFAERIMASHEHLDTFRLQEDLRYFLGAFISDLGMAFPLGSARFAVGLRGFEQSDLDLFVHQLGTYLSMLFGTDLVEGPSASPAVEKNRAWPDNGAGIRELLVFLSTPPS